MPAAPANRPVPRLGARRALRAATLGAPLPRVPLGCGTPGGRGVAGTAPAPNVLWTPPRDATAATQPAPPPALPPDLAERVAQLKLADVIDIALRNNTATSAAWADARAAAASYGAAKGQRYPTIAASGAVQTLKTVPSNPPFSVTRQFYSATLTGSWLLFDFGGRSGSIGEARAALLAADWTHNATLQNVVLAVEQAYFDYLVTRALLGGFEVGLSLPQRRLLGGEQRPGPQVVEVCLLHGEHDVLQRGAMGPVGGEQRLARLPDRARPPTEVEQQP